MAVSNIWRSQPIRMMGMSSGMDTESIIQQTLRLHQFKIDNQMRSRKLIEWKQQTHNTIKDEISSLRSTYLSSLGSKSLMNRNAFNTNVAKALTASGKAVSAVTVSGTPSASLGSMTIKEIKSLAKGASAASTGKVSASGDGFNSSATLGSMSFAEGSINFYNHRTSVTNTDGNTVSLLQSERDGASWSADASTEFTVSGTKVKLYRATPDGAISYSVNDAMMGTVTFDSEGKATIPGLGPLEIQISKDSEHNISVSAKEVNPDPEINDVELMPETKLAFFKEADVTAEDMTSVKLYQREDGVIFNGTKALTDNQFVGETFISINGTGSPTETTIRLTSNMTLAQFINAVNSSDAGVTLSYDRMQDKFTLESKTIGGASTLTFSDVGSGNTLNMIFGNGSGTGYGGAQVSAGSFAEVKIGDDWVIRDTNNFSYRGVNLRLHHTTPAEGAADHEDINISVTRDTDKAFNAIKDFIDSYNAIIKRLEGLLSERKSTNEASYKPLTDEEKSAMTDKQIEEWEAIARKGILRTDKGIQDLVSDLRASFFKQIEGTGMSASQLGLTTGSYFDKTGGQIIINEERLRAALDRDPDMVADVFVKIGTDANGQPKGEGLLYKIDGLMRDYVNTTQSNSLQGLERSYKDLNDRIAKLEERMWAEEDKLYRQFAAMETALSKMNQQGDWFSSMLGK